MSKDTELSDHINVSRQMLSQMRTGAAPIPSTVLEKVLDGATFKIGSEDLIELLPPGIQTVIRNFFKTEN